MTSQQPKATDFATRMRDIGVTNRMWRQIVLKRELDELKKYIDTVEAAFSEQLKREETEPQRPSHVASNEAQERFYEEQSQILHSLNTSFPALVRQAAFIRLYSDLERSLTSLCDCVDRHGTPLIRLADVPSKHKGIRKSRYFLTCAGVSFLSMDVEWQEIQRMNKIRNIFVHGGEVISNDLRDYCNGHSLLRMGISGQIILRPGYCQHAVEVVRRFHELLLAEIPDDLMEPVLIDPNLANPIKPLTDYETRVLRTFQRQVDRLRQSTLLKSGTTTLVTTFTKDLRTGKDSLLFEGFDKDQLHAILPVLRQFILDQDDINIHRVSAIILSKCNRPQSKEWVEYLKAEWEKTLEHTVQGGASLFPGGTATTDASISTYFYGFDGLFHCDVNEVESKGSSASIRESLLHRAVPHLANCLSRIDTVIHAWLDDPSMILPPVDPILESFEGSTGSPASAPA
ncbi:MAG: hypothetical protein C0478_14075 [Planctomyces sp.]|nr:hypothetical protein [Planctomyces sp.]